jgi:hypothetical protein
MPGSSDGGFKPSRKQCRTTSGKLSCIGEHQKENTPTSEDDALSMLARAPDPKTPSLEPVRWVVSHSHDGRKSRGSAESSSISACQLDCEQTEGTWRQIACHPLVVSTRQCASPIGTKAQIAQHKVLGMKQLGRVRCEIVEAQWQEIPWTGTQPKIASASIRRHSRTLSGTGFDGLYGSATGTSPLHPFPEGPSPLLSSLLPRNCIPGNSQRLVSDTLGCFAQGQSRLRRRLPRRHDVSETSDANSPSHKLSIDLPHKTTENEQDKISRQKHEKVEDQPRPHDVQDCALTSCPEFYQRSPSAAQLTASRDRVRFHL